MEPLSAVLILLALELGLTDVARPAVAIGDRIILDRPYDVVGEASSGCAALIVSNVERKTEVRCASETIGELGSAMWIDIRV